MEISWWHHLATFSTASSSFSYWGTGIMMNLTLIVMDEEELFNTFSDVGESVWLFGLFSTRFYYTSVYPQHANFNQTLAAIPRVLEFVGSQQAVAAHYKLASSTLYQWWAKLYGKSHKYAHILGRLLPVSPLHSITQLLSSNKTSSFAYFYVISTLYDAGYKQSTYHTAYKP